MLAFMMPGPIEMTIIGLIAVLLFGNRLPKAARSVGSMITEFKKGVKGIEEDTVGSVKKNVKDIKDKLEED
jgi:TatA/E family protein of Tat protein translocase